MKDLRVIMRLLQMSDSTFPVGSFSFSNGLETAAYKKIVYNAETLESYVEAIASQAAFSDGIIALHSYRAFGVHDYDRIQELDKLLFSFKMNDEVRQMLQRMGRKMAELGVHFYQDVLLEKWISAIRLNESPGTYPVAQGIIFALAGISEEDLFVSHQYGVMNMVLSAALRCIKVSHYETQEILFRLGEHITSVYEEVKEMSVDEMHSFVPEIDIFASLHEKENMRMFMN